MSTTGSYDRYPATTILAANASSWTIYAIGTYVLSRIWVWVALPYLLYVIWLEIRLLKTGCANCAYYGRACAFGRGSLCALFFPAGDPSRFADRDIRWTDMIPDMLVWIAPLLAGKVHLILTGWSWLIASLLVALLALGAVGPVFVWGTLACPHCEQRTIGCPACELFAGTSDE